MTSVFDDVLGDVCRAHDAEEFAAAALAAHDEALELGPTRTRDVVALTQRWSAFARSAVAGAADIVAAAHPGLRWQWYVSGSCGRSDALPGADVETLIVVDTDRTAALAAAAQVHALLDSVGLRADTNGAIASRSRFARDTHAWQRGIDAWLADPAADRGVVMTGLLADAAPAHLHANGLRTHLLGALSPDRPDALSAMLDDTLVIRETVPSRLRVVAGGRDAVDVKRAVVEPITKIARWAALSTGSSASSTLDRLHDGAALLPDDAADTLADCWCIATRLRWAIRSDSVRAGGVVRDDATLSTLSPQDRAQLRTAGREVSGVLRILNYTRPDRFAGR
ncbi:hypothetical protein HH308_03610 [Gordonia sp. TBRC 11910]|uniref:CBS domain-containing protein n=1 Tax=Gordonia asplenii TaxID=2725283 RepID=A0A848KQU6_9ACTN|nr:putative nucleotidyltransferase substrate binding domain-containing protein [Gordonia asplenii]NMO00297.1 hypothetical protein [Gordonia asplenii]